ncbi:hypothetical protein SAMN05192573_10975 [Mucilaginibacter gossypii]|uniref:Uncharacterized protein n=1 Tax=Mucilaginibacter gossypii TaxID=551996 RepID=A0A1G8BW23_9SPHI|nr:hypothetical protein SAMN05192573_10975 [Mucilaginibacter gossypii]
MISVNEETPLSLKIYYFNQVPVSNYPVSILSFVQFYTYRKNYDPTIMISQTVKPGMNYKPQPTMSIPISMLAYTVFWYK